LELQGVVDFYQTRRQEIYNDFEAFQEKTNARREELNEVLRREEAKQQEIIEGYKRAEQIKQDKNFYRIVLNEDA
jgi:CRISPR/Cas system CSM-associated protein Csm5 (group 7 of RAMP superfamily)